MISPGQFVKEFSNKEHEKEIELAMIEPDYISGRPKVVYDKDILSGGLSKPLPYLESYTPAANDRVMIVKGVIVGKII